MTFVDIPTGVAVFVDSNVLLFALTNHQDHGAACDSLLDRIDTQEISGVVSTYILGEVIHRLLTIEAMARFAWPAQGIANRLRRHPAEVQQLVRPRQGLDEMVAARLQVLPITPPLVSRAVDLIRQFGLLYGDALIVAVMRDQGLTHLASLDADFDRVPGLIRYSPV